MKRKGPDCTGWWEIDVEGENTAMVTIKATTYQAPALGLLLGRYVPQLVSFSSKTI